MAAKVATVSVEGLPFVRRQLEDFLPKEARAILRRATLKIASRVRNDIRAAAPRVSGRLRKAIVSKRAGGSRDVPSAEVRITQGRGAKHDAFYWRFVEYGTKTAAAHPFIAPVVARLGPMYPKLLESEIGAQIVRQLETRAKRQTVRP